MVLSTGCLALNSTALLELLERLGRGEVAAVEVAQTIAESIPLLAETSAATVDLDRERRCGYPEVVYSRGKTTPAIADIFRAQLGCGQDCFATLVSAEQARDLVAEFPLARHNPTAGTLFIAGHAPVAPQGRVVVVTAGTSDRPIAEETLETLHWMGCGAELIVDVGVAGPQRLLRQRHRLVDADAIVVVAGMEGALPSVVGGYVACPVIAVPTSVGYGASFGGVAALLGMLNSCASNVTVVNIDSGFKGGYVAGLIARRAAVAR